MTYTIASELNAIRIELLSDTTFGRGEGSAGQVDVEIDHDELGVPFVNGKTIRSLLRDSWLSMQSCFPELHRAAHRVFGPHGELDETSILRIGRATIGPDELQWIKAAVKRDHEPLPAGAILSAFTDIRSQTSEDRDSGAPERTTLRSMRVLLRDLTLTATLDWLAPPTSDDVRCLALAMLGTRHAGLARNRGRGHVRVGFDTAGETGDWWVATREYALGEKVTAVVESATSRVDARQDGAVTDGPALTRCWYVPYSLALTAPALVTGLMHDPNTVSTQRYIPGSMLRGAIAGAIVRKMGDPDRDVVAKAEFDSLVLGGSVAWLNAYPSYNSSQRTLPVPPGMKRDKHDAAGDGQPVKVLDLAAFDGRPDESHELTTEDGDLHWPDTSLAGISEPFMTTAGSSGYRVGVSVSSRVHQQRDRVKGRSWTDTSNGTEQPRGALFASESLDAGQSFAGVVQIRAADEAAAQRTLDRIRELLGDTLLLGRSRRAEYGGAATITFDDVNSNRCREWQASAPSSGICSGECFRIVLLSPCIVRDPLTGQIDPTALGPVLKEKLQDSAGNDRIAVKWVRTAFETVGGFNRKWRLELPQTLAVAAGSTVVLEATADISLADIKSLENAGLGERLAEGLGRFAFMKHEPLASSLTKPGDDPKAVAPLTDPPPLIETLQQRLAESALARAIDEAASDIARGGSRLPSNSLIGRLRELLRDQSDAGCENALQNLSVWLTDSDKDKLLKKRAMDKLDRCRVGSTSSSRNDSMSLTRWLTIVLSSEVPADLNFAAVAARCRLIEGRIESGGPNEANQAAKSEPVMQALRARPNWIKVRLIDAVLDQMALLNRRQKGAE